VLRALGFEAGLAGDRRSPVDWRFMLLLEIGPFLKEKLVLACLVETGVIPFRVEELLFRFIVFYALKRAFG